MPPVVYRSLSSHTPPGHVNDDSSSSSANSYGRPSRRRRVSAGHSPASSDDPTIATQDAGGPTPVAGARYKTELCRSWQETGGVCRYGDKCQFAHGVAELRSVDRHPRYKTELCRTFHTRGFCAYGPRCHFIHNDDEARRSAATTPVSVEQLLKQTEQIYQLLDVQQRLIILSRLAEQSSSTLSTVRRPSAPVVGSPADPATSWLQFRSRSQSFGSSSTGASACSPGSSPALSPQQSRVDVGVALSVDLGRLTLPPVVAGRPQPKMSR